MKPLDAEPGGSDAQPATVKTGTFFEIGAVYLLGSGSVGSTQPP
jgi:hypothetical protein